MSRVAVEVGLRPRDHGVVRFGAAVRPQVVADHAEDAADSRVPGRVRDDAHVRLHAGARFADRREAAAQRLQRGQLGGEVGALLVQAALQRHPHASEDLRRLAEHQRLAERLGQVVVRVDQARHQQGVVHADRGEVGMAAGHGLARADVGEHPVADDDGVVTSGTVRQQRPLRGQEQFGAVEVGVVEAGHRVAAPPARRRAAPRRRTPARGARGRGLVVGGAAVVLVVLDRGDVLGAAVGSAAEVVEDGVQDRRGERGHRDPAAQEDADVAGELVVEAGDEDGQQPHGQGDGRDHHVGLLVEVDLAEQLDAQPEHDGVDDHRGAADHGRRDEADRASDGRDDADDDEDQTRGEGDEAAADPADPHDADVLAAGDHQGVPNRPPSSDVRPSPRMVRVAARLDVDPLADDLRVHDRLPGGLGHRGDR